MVITLHPELEEFIGRLVNSGQFNSPEAAVAEAVLRMKEREDKMTWLRRELKEGLDQLDRGEGFPWDVREMKERLQNMHSTKRG